LPHPQKKLKKGGEHHPVTVDGRFVDRGIIPLSGKGKTTQKNGGRKVGTDERGTLSKKKIREGGPFGQ